MVCLNLQYQGKFRNYGKFLYQNISSKYKKNLTIFYYTRIYICCTDYIMKQGQKLLGKNSQPLIPKSFIRLLPPEYFYPNERYS